MLTVKCNIYDDLTYPFIAHSSMRMRHKEFFDRRMSNFASDLNAGGVNKKIRFFSR